jgi:hypothetical protein
MAKIETVGYKPGNPTHAEYQTKIINVSASVGISSVNQLKDVMVVQALLKYALEKRIDFRGEEFPEPCGVFIKTTAQLIKKYQRWVNRSRRVPVSIDGRINPVKGGAYAFGKNKLWTIYALNVDAMERALLEGEAGGDYIEAICQRWAFLRPVLNKSGTGSLDLALE